MREYVEIDIENLPYVDVYDTKIPAISLVNGLPVAVNGSSLKVYDWARQPEKPSYNKSEIGLGLVENISPYDMPVSTAVQTALDLLVPKTMVGQANGVASLDTNGKVPLSQLDDSVVGGMSYQGSWDASTNTPDLTTVKPKGQYYLVSVAGTQFGKSWSLGDTIISNGTSWDQIKTIQSVQSVNGKIGVVVINKDDVGLGNVDNTSDRNKPISVAMQTALDNKASSTALNNHINNQSNPHAVTKSQVGLGNVLNKEQLGKTETAADSAKLGGIVAANYYHKGNANLPTVDWTGKNLYAVGDIVAKKTLSTVFAIADDSGGGGGVLYLHQLLDVEIPNPLNNQSLTYDTASGKWVNKNIVLTVNGDTGNITINKSTIGLGNVDNTSDADKPISSATLTALNGKANQSDFTSLSGTVTGHINNTSNPHNVTKSQVGLGNVDNTSDLNKPISTATQTALNGKANKNGDVNEDFNVKNLFAKGNGLFSGDIVAKKVNATVFAASDTPVGSQYLYQLLDVDIPSPNNGESLVYSTSVQKWINKTLTNADVGALPLGWKPTWDDVTGKPSTFTPSPHTQAISTITGLQSALDGKQPTGNYEPAFTKNTAFNKNFGSAGNTVCEGNDVRLAAQANLDAHKADKSNPHVVTKSQVGLGNVDNTSDANKPISNATQTALDGKANKNGDSSEDFSVKNLNAKENVTAAGDVVAKKTGSVVFASTDSTGITQYLYQLLDVEIPAPQNGDALMYDGTKQKWINVSDVTIDGGTYAII